MTKKVDRRKQYTLTMLKNSLMTLLKTRSVSTITVKEICERADINRSTFYSYYQNQFDMLEQIEKQVMADIETYLNQYHFEQEEQALQMTEKLLEYIAANYEVCQTLLNENGDHSFEKRVMELVRPFLVRSRRSDFSVDTGLSDYASTFVISGSIYVIKQWLADGMTQSPQALARLITSVDFMQK